MISLPIPSAASIDASGKLSWSTCRLIVVTRSHSPRFIGK
jgi:hypothetical protein